MVAALGLATAAGGSSVTAQQPAGRPAGGPPPAALPAAAGELRGAVVDAESNAPVPTASVAVRARRDSALVAGAIVTPKGTFQIQGLRPGAYRLRVTSMGFAPYVQEFAITDAAPRVTVGPVRLARVAVALTAVTSTAERGAVSLEPDRNAYRAKDVAPAAAHAADVLEAVPSVQVDHDGKVSLRGNENVAVQINGRPSPIRGAQLGAYLKTLPANVVDKVEVIPNPSAKYDPEGMAGIINIVLKQNVDLGLSGGVNVGAANADRYNAAGNLGYQRGPWTTFTSLGVNGDDRTVSGVNDRERHAATGGGPLSFTNQDVLGRNGNFGVNLTTTNDFKLTRRDLLSTVVTVGDRRGSDATTSTYEELDATRALTDSYDRLRDTDTRGSVVDVSTALKRTFDARTRHELSSEVRFSRYRDEDDTGLWRQPLAGTAGSAREQERDSTDALQQQLVAQVDYVRPFKGRRKLETGYKGTARWLDRDLSVMKDAMGTGAWVRSTLSNSFEFDERVQAVYAVYSQGVRKVDLQGGLRAEYASRDFSLAADGGSYPYHYTSLFPSAVATYNRSAATQMKASYSRRIRRPGTQELNPFPSFFDVQNVFIGNPRLNPEYTDAYELGFTRSGKRGSLQVSPFYRRTTNVIRVDINTADVVDGRDVTTVSFENLATSNSWGTDVNGTFRAGKRLNGLAGFNVFRMVTDGGSQTAVGSDAVTWMSRVNATWQATPALTVQGSYFYRAPMNIERGRFAGMQSANLVLRQKVNGDKAAVTLRLVDPFNTNRFLVRAGDDNLTQITSRNPGIRGVFLGYQYNFGRPPRVRATQPDDQQRGPGFPG
jgi:outer membrane receptor protein involved in Fe transport